jgi:peptide/nickel transport system substrate-binding protein
VSPTRTVLLIAFVPLAALAAYAAWALDGIGERRGRSLEDPARPPWGRADAFPDVELDRSRSKPQGGVWRGAVPEPRTLNPLATRYAVTHRMVVCYTHDALCDLDPLDGSLRPALASAYERDADDEGLWWFELREGAVFEDGAPVTLADVRFTYDAARSDGLSPSLLQESLRGVDFVESPTPGRFGLRLPPERRHDLIDVAHDFRVLQKDWFERELDRLSDRSPGPRPGDPDFAAVFERIRGPGPASGPYRFPGGPDLDDAWSPGRELVIVQNPRCWQRTARPEAWNLAAMKLRFLEDRTAVWAALERGELDWIVDLGDVTERLVANETLRAWFRSVEYTSRSASHFYCAWNHHIPALREPRVRRALTMLFDREYIARTLCEGRAKIAQSWLPPDHPAYPTDLATIPYAPARARTALSEAGYTDEKPLTLRILTDGRPPFDRIADALVHAGRECGNVAFEIVRMPWSELEVERHDFASGRYAGMLLIHGHGYVADPVARFGPGNDLGYDDPENTALLTAIEAAETEDERNDALRAWARYVHRVQPVTLLVHPRLRVLVHSRYHDARPTRLEGLKPELWWVPVDEQIVR